MFTPEEFPFKSNSKIQQTLANPVTVNPDRNMENENFCSQLVHTSKDTWELGARGLSDCVEGS
jgi:hypothetical protein